MVNKDVEGIWKYLHHLLSGAILLIEGIFLGVLNKSIIAVIVFVGIGAFLFIDDLLAETIDKSIFDNFHSNPIRLKIVGVLFFIFMQIIFILILLH
ncbi:MAG: hypothetical protein EU544_01730 [Promethearchaeota archaeon]|nr:MAG: hypothetical protein EU544_01730 [Candidatus Lokiarchaeota archaeon]